MIKQRRLLILVSTFPCRSQTFVMHHVTGMLDRGYDVSVLTNNSDLDAWDSIIEYQEELKERVFKYQMPSKKTLRIAGSFRLLLKNLFKGRLKYFNSWNFLKFGKDSINMSLPYLYDKALDLGDFDIVHCHFGPVGVLGAHLKTLGITKKLVVTFHGYDVSMILKQESNSLPYENLFKICDLILPISDKWKTKLSEIGSPIERMKVHRVGIDISKFSFMKKTRLSSNSLRIVTTARCVEKKGLKYGVEAIAKVKNKYPSLDIKYDLIGDGPLIEELMTLTKQLELSDSITFHGAKSHGDVAAILRSADLFMLPSVTAVNGDQEGIPVAIMEAMALGLGVIATVHSGIPELVEHGINGYLVPEKDSDAIAEGIIYLTTNFETLSFMRKSAREKVESNHNIQIQNDYLINEYEKLLSSI